MKTLGIDPGYDRVGIAVLEKQKNGKELRLFSECFNTDRTKNIHERIFSISQRLHTIIQKYKPDRLAIENLFHSKNSKTVMGVSEARGVIINTGMQYKLDIQEYTPNQIKNATTGYGKATKEQVYSMVKKLIVLPKNIKQDDEIDAIAVAITDLAHVKNL
jgi:crossover junction endodeoxyribonuclease RuvC